MSGVSGAEAETEREELGPGGLRFFIIFFYRKFVVHEKNTTGCINS